MNVRRTRRRWSVLAAGCVAATVVPLAAAPPALATPPAAAPVLTAPAPGDTVGGTVVLDWNAVSGAVKYRVQVSPSATFESTAISYSADTVSTRSVPSVTLPLGTLHWRVAGLDSGGLAGPYAQGSFSRVWADAPELLAPAPSATLVYPGDPLLFRWNPLPGAKSYKIQIDTDAEFITPDVDQPTNHTSYTLTAPQPIAQTFYWRVQAVSGTTNSPWSETRTYAIEWPERPTLLSPINTTVEDVAFSWTPVKGAVTYELEVSPNPDFTNNLTLDVVVRGTRYSPPVTLDNGSYFWRVRAKDATTNFGDWSATVASESGPTPAQFTRAWSDQPTPLAPDDADFFVNVPTLRWTPVDHATTYEVWLSTDANFSPGTFQTCTTNQTSLTPYGYHANPPALGTCTIPESRPQLNQVYYWKVRALDGPKNVNGIYSVTRSFMLRHVALVTPLAPISGSAVEVPTLEWQPVRGVARYNVYVTDGNGSTLSGYPVTTFGNSYTPIATLPATADGVYKWYVRTLDDQSRLGLIPPDTHAWSFTLTAPVPSGSIALLRPAPLGSSSVMPTMSWTPVDGASYYRIWYSPSGSGVFTQFLQNGVAAKAPYASYTFNGTPLNAGAYDWFVEAYSVANAKLGESAVQTFVVNNLGTVTNVSPSHCASDGACTPVNDTPSLSWQPVAGAGAYLVHLANDPAFTNVLRVYKTTYPTLTPRESLLDSVAGQAYYWFVQPCRSILAVGVVCGRFDNEVMPTATAFRKRSLPVEPISPADGAVVPASGSNPEWLTFTWADYFSTNSAATPPASQSAKQYRIEISTVPDFASTIDSQVVDQATYTPHAKNYPDGPLYWRVQAIDGSGNNLTFSTPRQVVKATPPLSIVHPLPNATVGGVPYFQWGAQAHSARYELEIYKNGDQLFSSSNRVLTLLQTKLTAHTPSGSLPAGNYAWRVRRVELDERFGPWTSGGVFALAPAAPSLVTPADDSNAATTELLFSWTAVTGAAQYQFESSASSAFSTTVESVKTPATSWAPVKAYPDGRTYWRVKVLDASDNVMAVSAVWSFVKDGTIPTVTSKTPTSNAALNGPFSVTFSEPVTGVSASTFSMVIAGTATGVAGTVTVTSPTAAKFVPTNALVPGETYTVRLTSGISDLNGNPLVETSWNVRALTAVDALSPAVQEVWDRDYNTGASGSYYLASRTAGAKVSFTFTGTSTAIVGRRAVDGGYGDVYLDGVKQATVNFYSSGTQWRTTVWSKSGLADTKHVVELRPLATKHSASKDIWVYVDGFKAGASYFEETHASVKQAFRSIAATTALGKSYQLATHVKSLDTGGQPYTQLRFKGTRISWKAFRAPYGGIAAVYVDGVGRGYVDLYASAKSTSPVVVWTSPLLSNAQHTVKIVLLGTRRTGATGYDVTFDSFAIS